MGTLAKIAIGLAVAKGVGGMLKRSGGALGAGAGGAQPPGGLKGIMVDILGGRDARQSGGTGRGDGGLLGSSGGELGDFLDELGDHAPAAGRRRADGRTGSTI
ncbi:hypothetical protein DEA8626_03838 [Defluviimonas aquaemixtae]|uniref:Uncharacterized protein n=2 Tax=Albidovulum aquaemixtae TaxID=1542388 RepID=A0A2R8BN67_9RHOB|nr:hypothetical protein DEA8626_03838 [Defluviimonas aquaemixtae]